MSADVAGSDGGASSSSSTRDLCATAEMCHFAFDLLSSHFSKSVRPELPPLPAGCPEAPLFVTWEKRAAGRPRDPWDLRGCIGTLSPSKLAESIPQYVLTSALRDSRFNAIAQAEMPSLRVSVSLLVKFEECADCYDWEIGKHGLIVNFLRGYSATYLPEVAREHNMTKQYAVESLIKKAGYNGKVDEKDLRCTRYQSSKCTVTYDEWLSVSSRSR